MLYITHYLKQLFDDRAQIILYKMDFYSTLYSFLLIRNEKNTHFILKFCVAFAPRKIYFSSAIANSSSIHLLLSGETIQNMSLKDLI